MKTLNGCFILIILLSAKLKAQVTDEALVSFTLNEIVLMDMRPNNSAITITLTSPTEAGLPLTNTTASNQKYIQYSSAVTGSEARTISAQISSGTVPPGTSLTITAGAVSTGAGTRGATAGLITLSSSAQTIITGIGGGYTGNGSTNGHPISYSLNIINYNLLDSNSSNTVTILFTLSDN